MCCHLTYKRVMPHTSKFMSQPYEYERCERSCVAVCVAVMCCSVCCSVCCSHVLSCHRRMNMIILWEHHRKQISPPRTNTTWLMSHARTSHATLINELGHTHERWVMSHIWTSRVTHMNESCHTHERVMSHIWMSPVTHMNESCHTYEWVLSHIWMSHVPHINASWHTYEWVMSCHTYEWVMPHTHAYLPWEHHKVSQISEVVEVTELHNWVLSRISVRSLGLWAHSPIR